MSSDIVLSTNSSSKYIFKKGINFINISLNIDSKDSGFSVFIIFFLSDFLTPASDKTLSNDLITLLKSFIFIIENSFVLIFGYPHDVKS